MSKKIKIRDRLYFDKYQYCVSFHMKELHLCRAADHIRVNDWLNARMTWYNDMRNKNFGGSWNSVGDDQPGIEKIRHDCHEFIEFLEPHKDQCKLTISVHWGWLYINDLKIIRELQLLKFVEVIKQEEAVVSIPRGSIRLVRSPNKYRSYFRGCRLTENQRENLITFVANNPEVRTSPGMQEWMQRKWSTWVRDSYFIDYDNEYIRTMLELTCSGAIRKTLNIVNDK